MALHDQVDEREADAGARKFVLRMQPLEGLEQFRRVACIESRTVVFDKVNLFSILFPPSNFNRRLFRSTREFEGVGEQVGKDLPEQRQVAKAIGQVTDMNYKPRIIQIGAYYRF